MARISSNHRNNRSKTFRKAYALVKRLHPEMSREEAGNLAHKADMAHNRRHREIRALYYSEIDNMVSVY